MKLYELTRGWLQVLSKREDLEFSVGLDAEGKGPPTAPFAADALEFASQRQQLAFEWKLRSNRSVDGFLNLDLRGFQEGAYLVLGDGTVVNEDDMYALDVDAFGVGTAAWYVAPAEGRRFICWSIEDHIEYPSLTDYLTKGAKLAFSYGGQPWQRARGPVPLAEHSVSATTPLPELRTRLIDRGTDAALADGLLEWLGPSVSLLLPK